MIGIAVVVLASFMAWERFNPDAYLPREPSRFEGGSKRIDRAGYFADRVWIVTEAQELWTVDERTEETQRLATPGPTIDLCVENGRPVIVTDTGLGDNWSLHAFDDAAWTLIGQVPKWGDGIVGLACDAEGVNVLTTRRLVAFSGDRWTTRPLSPIRIPAVPQRVFATTPSDIFVGFNEGEFGGGLMRIERATGRVTDLASNVSGDLCGGPLNPECDPVRGVVRQPGSPDCVVAAIGLMHLGARGRLIQACGARVETLYLGPCLVDGYDGSRGTDGEPYCTEAFGGVVSAGDTLLAVGNSGVSWIGEDGRLQRRAPLPRVKSYGPFRLGFGMDAIVVGSAFGPYSDPVIENYAASVVGR